MGGMHQGGGFGSSQSNLGRVGGSMDQGGGFGNKQSNHGGVGGSMVQGGGFGSKQSNHGGVCGSMVQRGGSGNSQSNPGNVAGDMVQDYSAQMSCKILQKRIKFCGEGLDREVSCDTFRKFYKKKNCKNKANDYQGVDCRRATCGSRDYQNDQLFQQCCLNVNSITAG